ncbi:MAG: hypothetical protein ACXVAX_06695 [Pseudobdellovibrio sp.]
MKLQDTLKSNQTSATESVSVTVEFGDVLVYNEMADQTSVKLNLIEQIHAQLNQLEEMNQKRQFLMREVLEVIS